MQRRSNVATGIVFILVMVLHALTVSTARGQTIIPIAQARQLPLMTVVTVEGQVTVSPCDFLSFLDCGFAFQDETGGLWVSEPDSNVYLDVDLDFLKLGRRVRVTGQLRDNGVGLLVLAPYGVVVLTGSQQQVEPQELLSPCDIVEENEGFLKKVKGRVREIRPDPPYGFAFFIVNLNNDSCQRQVFIAQSLPDYDQAFIDSIQIDEIRLWTGFRGQYEKFHEIQPRSMRDVGQAE